jgi:hypothetical protein
MLVTVKRHCDIQTGQHTGMLLTASCSSLLAEEKDNHCVLLSPEKLCSCSQTLSLFDGVNRSAEVTVI